MNALQKNHARSLKRKVVQSKNRKYNTTKTGRKKVQDRLAKEYTALRALEQLRQKTLSTAPLPTLRSATDYDPYSSAP